MRALKLFLSCVLVLLPVIPTFGQLGVVASDGVITIIDLERMEIVHEIIDSKTLAAHGVQITPDNSLAIVASSAGGRRELVFLDLTARPPRIIDRVDLARFGGDAIDTAITPDGRFALTQVGFLMSVDIASRQVIDVKPYGASQLVITPDGRFAVMWGGLEEGRAGAAVSYIAEDGTLWDTGQRLYLGSFGISAIYNLAITPNGRLVLASGSLRGLAPYVHVFSMSEDGIIEYVESIGIVGPSVQLGIAVTPDGRKVYLISGPPPEIRILSIDDQDRVRDTGGRIAVPRGIPAGGNGVRGIAMASSEEYGSFAFLCSTNSSAVSIIHTDTDTVLPQFIQLRFPPYYGIAVQR